MAAGTAMGVALGCTDRLPTLSGDERFPSDLVPTTVQLVLESGQFLNQTDVFSGGTGPLDAPYLLVANNFEGVLNAHTLVRFDPLPDTLLIDFLPDADYTIVGGRIHGAVSDSLAVSHVGVSFQLWTVTEPWDSATVTWDHRVDTPEQRVPWQTPGGGRGELLSAANWVRGDPEAGDSLVWDLAPEDVDRIARGEIHGLMVTLADAGTRASILPLTVEARIRASVSDTIIARFFSGDDQNFIFSPEAPTPANVLRVGGIRSDRTYLRMGIEPTLPACPGIPDPGCPRVPASEVTLNRVDLLVDPVPVAPGFRPLGPFFATVREVLEPELGRRATLGQVVEIDSISASRFHPGGSRPIALNVTSSVAAAIAAGRSEVHLMLLEEPEARGFGYAWFGQNPRLRFLYTLHHRPQLP